MQTRKIGTLEVSVVGLGTNNFGARLDEEKSAAVVNAAIDAGINFLDTAESYGGTKSEEFIGKALGSRRDEILLATKFGWAPDSGTTGGGTPEYARNALEASLRRLQTDRVDLYILHRPDAGTPITETLGVLDEFVKAGKVREIGCSNFTVEQLEEAKAAVAPGAARFVNLQNRYSLMHRAPEGGILQACERMGIGFVPYSPLAGGLLTGKFHRGEAPPAGTRIANMPEDRRGELLSEESLSVVEELRELGERNGRTMLELAFSWLLTQPAVSSVIAGATSPAQIQANVAAADWTIPASVLEEIDRIVPAG